MTSFHAPTPVPAAGAPDLRQAMTALLVAALLGGTALDASADKNREVKGNTRTSVNKNTNVNNNRNTNVNKNVNVNSNKNVNVNTNRHVDVDVDVDRGFHPVAAVATVALTAAVIGSMTPSLPPSGCVPVMMGNVMYQQCGPNWYQPQYVGTSVQYVVVVAPR
jgi:hypothetical protein